MKRSKADIQELGSKTHATCGGLAALFPEVSQRLHVAVWYARAWALKGLPYHSFGVLVPTGYMEETLYHFQVKDEGQDLYANTTSDKKLEKLQQAIRLAALAWLHSQQTWNLKGGPGIADHTATCISQSSSRAFCD